MKLRSLFKDIRIIRIYYLLVLVVLIILFFVLIYFFVTVSDKQSVYSEPNLAIDIPISQNYINNKPLESIQEVIDKKIISPEITSRLQIPIINVDAALESVGLSADGTMGLPRNPANVAWYNKGPYPGEIGSAVIAGHYGFWKKGNGSVFDDLHKLKVGDEIYFKDKNSSTTLFIVSEIKNYNPKDDALAVFNSNDNKSHLNLITCEGTFNKTTQSYSQRLIIFADKK